MSSIVLTCADPLQPRRTDPHFARETRAARLLGATVALIDHDAVQRGDAAAAVRRVPRDLGPAWYRGWMLSVPEYTALAAELAARGTPLVVPPDRYRTAHELPNWFDTFAAVTPRSRWLPLAPRHTADPAALAELAASLRPGPVVVKDYVKARKHEWEEACFVPDATDPARLQATVTRLVELADDFLAGGVVIREFEPYADTGEARVWWIDGVPALVGPHPDTPDRHPDPGPIERGPIGAAVAALGCRFVTTDLARRTDGVWRVVEVGDGQVSGLPTSIEPTELLTPLLPR